VLDGIAKTIGRLAGSPVAGVSSLGGGSFAAVYRVTLEDGRTLAAKVGAGLAIEGTMLRYLALNSGLPVPRVVHAADDLLVIDFIEAGDGIDRAAEVHAAELLADLHAITTDAFGFEHATMIGGLEQPNPWTPGWLDFFRDQRLLYMGREALEAGRLPGRLMKRLEVLAGRLDRWLEEPAAPALLHGDMWTGNVLCREGRIAGFVDPAVYYGDAEIELAFATLFSTFGTPFFERYGELRPLRPGFFEERRDLYNLYPLLVHTRLFGGSYVATVERSLTRFGC
jgi:fructosamine-3-kinase